MSFLKKPTDEEWEEHHQWFETTTDDFTNKNSYKISEHAAAIVGDVENAYCSGAYISATVMALSAIESQLKEPGFKGNTNELFKKAGLEDELDEIRRKRNSYVHTDPDNPALSMEDVVDNENRDKLKRDSEDAITTMLKVFYMNSEE